MGVKRKSNNFNRRAQMNKEMSNLIDEFGKLPEVIMLRERLDYQRSTRLQGNSTELIMRLEELWKQFQSSNKTEWESTNE